MTRSQNTWQFVIEFYPGYSDSDDIASEGDLYKLVTGEYEEGDCAHELLMNKYDGDINSPQLERDWQWACGYILETAIKGYLEQQKEIV